MLMQPKFVNRRMNEKYQNIVTIFGPTVNYLNGDVMSQERNVAIISDKRMCQWHSDSER